MKEQKKPTRKFYMVFAVLFAILILGLAVVTVVLPDQNYSSAEKRSLAQFPSLDLSSVTDGSFMNGIEDWEADQFPLRSELMQVKSQINLLFGSIRSQNVYRCSDGSLMEAFTMPSDDVLSKQSKAILDFAERYPETSFYFCLAPNAISVETEKLPKAVLTDDQNIYIDYMEDAFSSVGTFVDVRNVFSSNKGKMDLYYHTDHHWTTDAAYLAWQELYDAMELTSSLSYTSGVVCNTFSGSLVSASGFMASCYDSIKIYIPEEDPVYTVTYDNAQKMTASVYSLEHAQGNDPYELFFGGNHPKITIRTAADTERKLLILKDSYANCLIPFLIPDFAQITIIDARYYYDDLDMEMLSTGYTDVLFLYNVNTLSEDNCLVPVLNNEQYGTEGDNVISGDGENGSMGDGSTEDDSTENGSTENTSTENDSTEENGTETEGAEDTNTDSDTETNDTAQDTEDNSSNTDDASGNTEDTSSETGNTDNGTTGTESGSNSGNDGTAGNGSSENTSLTLDDIAFIGDSRTLSLASGGRLEYKLVPDSSVFATWGGKLTDDTAIANAQIAASANKDVAIFWFGINDVQGDPNIRDDASLFLSNYEAIIDKYLQINPDSQVVILSILTTSTGEKDYYAGQEDNIRAYNSQLASLCSQKGYTYLDITFLYTGDACFAEGDYIHFSKEWYVNSFLPMVCGALSITVTAE